MKAAEALTISDAKFELQLLSGLTQKAEFPISGTNLLVIGEVSGLLHVAAFDAAGKKLCAVEEASKERPGSLITELKNLLKDNWKVADLKALEIKEVFRLGTLLVRSFQIDALIEGNQALWRDERVREWLFKKFNNKCWYSEAQESVSSYHLDHYRPKGRMKDDKTGATSQGYWWLAFDWTNYRVCGQLLNVKKVDQFPFADAVRGNAAELNSIDLESPILIDPRSQDTRLVSFEFEDEETCVAVPAGDIIDEDKDRAERTIEILGLNRLARLNAKRAEFWTKARLAIADYQGAAGKQALRTITKINAITRLREMVIYDAEFSSVAEACIHKLAPTPLRAAVFEAAAAQ